MDSPKVATISGVRVKDELKPGKSKKKSNKVDPYTVKKLDASNTQDNSQLQLL